MFERFSEAARAVLVEAEDLAAELGSPDLVVGHLLYGLAEVRDEAAGRPLRNAGITGVTIRGLLPGADAEPGSGVDPDALRAIGIDYDGVRSAVEETFGAGALEAAPDRRTGARRPRPRFTRESKSALEQALRVAVELGHRRIAPGHLLLGILRLDDELVAAVLRDADTSVAGLSAAVLAELAEAA